MSEAIPYLSVSKINVFTRCPLQGKFRYVDKIPEKALGVFLFGKVIHAAIERALRAVEVGGKLPSWQDMTDWLPSIFDSEIKEDEGRATFCGWDWDEDTLDAQKTDAPKLVRMVREDVLPAIKPVLVEAKFNYALPSKIGEFKIYGVIDLFEEGGMLTDWKTTSKVSPNAKKLDIQLPAYTIHTNDVYHAPASAVNEARKIFLVRGSKPKIESVNYRIHEGHRQWFRDQAARVWQMIVAESFIGCTGGWWCSADWCSYYAGCQGELQ